MPQAILSRKTAALTDRSQATGVAAARLTVMFR